MTIFFASLLFLLPFAFLALVVRLFGRTVFQKYTHMISSTWGKFMLKVTGGKFHIHGTDLVPKEGPVIFIGNHDGSADIAMLLAYAGRPIAFIAKHSLIYFPFLNFWMIALGCVFLKRGNIRSAKRAIEQGVQRLQKNYCISIFPEGTRSRGGEMKRFKPGSFKLALQSGAAITPFVILDSYKIIEEKGLIQPAEVSIQFLEPVTREFYEGMNAKELSDHVEAIIHRELPKLSHS
jgi:1-acyl-sn-glycerol-3-phosphate acyltransferase